MYKTEVQQIFITYWLTGNEPLPEILMIYILFYAHICIENPTRQ